MSPEDDKLIECGNCGAQISIDETRCPRCGVSLYDLGLDDENRRSKNQPAGLSATLKTLLAAIPAVIMLAVMIWMILSRWTR